MKEEFKIEVPLPKRWHRDNSLALGRRRRPANAWRRDV